MNRQKRSRRGGLTLAVSVLWLSGALALGGCAAAGGNKATPDGGDDTESTDDECEEGATQCEGTVFQTCVDGEWQDTEECDGVCDPELGCLVCTPGEAYCEGSTSMVCNEDGTGWIEEECDPLLGLICDESSGLCEGVCAEQTLGPSYIGCEYYAVVTANLLRYDFDFAVVLANTSATATASVNIEGGKLATPVDFEIPPNSVHVERLPWDFDLKVCPFGDMLGICNNPPDDGVFVEQGAYHIRSNQPVTAYQFSPLDYTDGDIMYSYTNDASLLLPVNALSGKYVVIAWPPYLYGGLYPYPSMATIVATEDGTNVTVTARATAGGGSLGTFDQGVAKDVILDAGDALELLSNVGDLTGSLIEADQPVAVIAGHYATNVPTNLSSQDHLEEQLFPVETLGNSYVAAAPAVPTILDGKERFIRVVAAESGTTIAYEPPISGAETYLTEVGDFAEIAQQTGDYLITADKKVIVAQYMESALAGGDTGDPAMALVVATDQYRDEYLFHAPANYETNYANVIAPSGAAVTLDGAAVTGFVSVGSTGYEVARVELDNTGDGNHFATGDQPFGISVYGYGWCTSYWYPGGLNLEEIVIE